MEYDFLPNLLLRTPAKTAEDYFRDHQRLLGDEVFRLAIYLASPVFFAVLAQRSFQLRKLSAKEKITLGKYINRYCYRPTPFGLFASVTLCQWKPAKLKKRDRPSAGLPYFHVDETFCGVAGQLLLASLPDEQAKFESNPSVYRALQEFRFFRTDVTENGERREYLLQATRFTKLLKELIEWCRIGRTKSEIIDTILKSASCSRSEAVDYAGFLIDAQLLLNGLRQTITGPGYLNQLTEILTKFAPQTATVPASLLHRVRKLGMSDLDQVRETEIHLQTWLTANHYPYKTAKLNAILRSVQPDAGPAVSFQQVLRDGLYALDILTPPGSVPQMVKFVQAFQQYFEGQTVRLLAALDPEIGIGYQMVSQKSNPLLKTLAIDSKSKSESRSYWTKVHALLLSKWLAASRQKRTIISLTEKDLTGLEMPQEKQFLGMSVLFRINQTDQVYIESAGGNNAPGLLGRFTVADPEILDAAVDMARQLERQNPDILFAEILHLSDPHVDNVNRRACIYDYEIPVTAGSVLPKEKQLELDDLYIRVEQNHVILFSAKHGKPVVPRLTSAYNHHLNKLPLFRFLADLPYQYGKSSLSFELSDYFPDQSFYPRVEYKEAVLALATWVVGSAELAKLQQADSKEAETAFRQLAEKLSLPVSFSLAEGDQQLVFNREHQDDILFFCGCVKQKQVVILKEYFSQPWVKQYNTYLMPLKPLTFPSAASAQPARTIKIKRKYIPGTDWLYLKIYAPAISTDRLLLRLLPILRKRYVHGRIGKWFFVRYNDHSPHIRLRISARPEMIGEILLACKSRLEDRIQQHVIREYQIDVYSRELERYALAGIDRTEDFFWASSELVISYLQQKPVNSSVASHLFAIVSTLTIMTIFLPDTSDQLKFAYASYEGFLPEFKAANMKVALDKKYRQLSPELKGLLANKDQGLWSGSVRNGKRFTGIIERISGHISSSDIRFADYLRSIVHMHLNRIFSEDGRKQEMITYYMLYKYLSSVDRRLRG
jgi:thiopeptide-type bacteriocin biosynthesis protein